MASLFTSLRRGRGLWKTSSLATNAPSTSAFSITPPPIFSVRKYSTSESETGESTQAKPRGRGAGSKALEMWLERVKDKRGAKSVQQSDKGGSGQRKKMSPPMDPQRLQQSRASFDGATKTRLSLADRLNPVNFGTSMDVRKNINRAQAAGRGSTKTDTYGDQSRERFGKAFPSPDEGDDSEVFDDPNAEKERELEKLGMTRPRKWGAQERPKREPRHAKGLRIRSAAGMEDTMWGKKKKRRGGKLGGYEEQWEEEEGHEEKEEDYDGRMGNGEERGYELECEVDEAHPSGWSASHRMSRKGVAATRMTDFQEYLEAVPFESAQSPTEQLAAILSQHGHSWDPDKKHYVLSTWNKRLQSTIDEVETYPRMDVGWTPPQPSADELDAEQDYIEYEDDDLEAVDFDDIDLDGVDDDDDDGDEDDDEAEGSDSGSK